MRHATDPVCGMSVDPAHAPAESNYEGETFYFCSENCRQRFEANPTGYTAGRSERNGSDVETHEPPRTTNGGMTSPKFGSAGSGGAEFEQTPERHGPDKIHDA